MKKVLILLLVLVLIGVAYFLVQQADYKDAEFLIDGQVVRLDDGAAKYFGNELVTDLDGDGDKDVAFIITHQPGGSGTFYYAVAALKTGTGYVGSDAYFLGDRISPQATTFSPNPRHKMVVVFNYADRAAGEPMTAVPTVGQSVYLKIDPQTSHWALVEPSFEGESL